MGKYTDMEADRAPEAAARKSKAEAREKRLAQKAEVASVERKRKMAAEEKPAKKAKGPSGSLRGADMEEFMAQEGIVRTRRK